jgi:hypothetical protein
MNSPSVQAALDQVLAAPDFQASLVAHILARREERAAFARSDVFKRMVAALTGQAQTVAIDSEEAAYFPDRLRATAGWEFASAEDIKLFFAVIAEAHAETVTPGSLTADEDNPFDNCSFQHYGLHVRVMSGQGTFIRVSNGK